MRRERFDAEAEVHVLLRSRRQLAAIAAALAPEALHPAGEKAHARLKLERQKLKIKFEARDSSSLRAIMNSYLRMLKASNDVCSRMLQLEGKRREALREND